MTDLLALMPAAPLAGFAVNASLALSAVRRRDARPLALPGPIAVVAAATSFVLAVAAVLALRGAADGSLSQPLWTWIPGVADASLRLDSLSAVMILVVTFIGTLIHVYSIGYMGRDPGYARFMAYLNLFLFFMLVLVLASNYLLLFVGWEGVGLCSYLLIGFWYERKAAADGGKKAFIVNRVGDAAFLLGIFSIFTTFGTVDMATVATSAGLRAVETQAGILTVTALLLFVGACGKSAQLPLHVWLPDAMEGPTPVSALIHAATMVTAGVYVIARSSALFSQAPKAMVVVAVVGAATALVAATIALVQNDIKRVLAYSTISQLGYMFLACGVGAYAAAMFHLMTHAFFKALLFLGAGSVIHALGGEQDLRRMGGLRGRLPWTHITMLVGCVAIAGLPPFAGFVSKDAILLSAFAAPGPGRLVFGIGLLTAALTAFYMFRLYHLAFGGMFRGSSEAERQVHEAPATMRWPLVVLALGAALAGFVEVEVLHVRHAVTNRALEFGLMALGAAVALAGLGVAWRFYARPGDAPSRIAASFPRVHRALSSGYDFDDLYDAVFVRGLALGGGRVLETVDRRVIDGADGAVGPGFGVNGLAWLCRDIVARLSNVWDRYVVDGAVNLAALVAENGSYLARTVQTGFVQQYVWMMVVGILALMVVGRIAMGIY